MVPSVSMELHFWEGCKSLTTVAGHDRVIAFSEMSPQPPHISIVMHLGACCTSVASGEVPCIVFTVRKVVATDARERAQVRRNQSWLSRVHLHLDTTLRCT